MSFEKRLILKQLINNKGRRIMEEDRPKEVREVEQEADQLEKKIDSAGGAAVFLYIENTTTRPGWWW
jgi:hypothetical protein